ncbi:MAG: hypothetical protein KF802_03680 [Bdellovibrionaceae bacterium]|nr:hypothetical protein [Pseudobdellovibrionaceae bacterium]MBX3033277.1 hypothetical protein [Pseudobdellovibrionaceae bacterium]
MRFLSLIMTLATLAAPAAFAQDVQLQNRVNLEDVNIQGEANKNRNLFMNRNRFGLDDRVKVRRDFRREMEDAIPPSFKQLPAPLLAEPPSRASVQK